jgi:hypothetical protein
MASLPDSRAAQVINRKAYAQVKRRGPSAEAKWLFFSDSTEGWRGLELPTGTGFLFILTTFQWSSD